MSETKNREGCTEDGKKEKVIMPTPFRWLDEKSEQPLARILWIILIIAAVAMYFIDIPLETKKAPLGIVSLELQKIPLLKTQGTLTTLFSWSEAQRLQAAFSLGVDYLYIVLYTATLSLACTLAARRFFYNGFCVSARVGVILSWAVLLMALFDSLENYFLLSVLTCFDAVFVTVSEQLPVFVVAANRFAAMKFVLLGLVFLYLLVSFFEKMVTLFCGSKEQKCWKKSKMKG